MSEIVIPYTPRFPQTEIHPILDAHRFVVLVAHRRMGKTVGVINHLIKEALLCQRRDGMFAYTAPFRNQAKAIAWRYLKHYTAAIPGRKVNESDLIVTMPNAAQVRIFGADNPDALRGLYFDGVVLDEVAQMAMEVWGEIVRPALADRGGFAVFIGTPKGANLFQELYLTALNKMREGDKSWHAALYRADETGVLSADELAAIRSEISENAWRQEFLCDFTAADDDVLIPVDLAADAAKRPAHTDRGAPLVMGVDVARFGSDRNIVALRQGRDARSWPWEHWGNSDLMQTASRLGEIISRVEPDAVFVDGGVVDRLRELGFAIIEVNAGARAMRPERYANKRAEMWDAMKDWLKTGAIPAEAQLKTDLSTPTYFFDAASRLVLEPKDKIKERLGRSPDMGDALSLTFAQAVQRKDVRDAARAERQVCKTDYDLWTWPGLSPGPD